MDPVFVKGVMMATIAAENLLKAILELDENGEAVIAARLAEFLKITSAAVSMSLKRLQRKAMLLPKTIAFALILLFIMVLPPK